MLNSITLIGRLTRDPELRTTSNGVSVASFSLAVERDYQRNGEEKADFIDVTAWRQPAEFAAKYFSRGTLVCVSGALHSRKYTDRGGQNRIAWEVVADKVYPCERRDGTNRKPTDTPNPVDVAFEDLDDGTGGELPF